MCACRNKRKRRNLHVVSSAIKAVMCDSWRDILDGHAEEVVRDYVMLLLFA